MDVHLYVPNRPLRGTRSQRFAAVDVDDECYGFSLYSATDVYYLVRAPAEVERFGLVDVMAHEELHLVLSRVGEERASRRMDRVSNLDEWERRGGSLGGF